MSRSFMHLPFGSKGSKLFKGFTMGTTDLPDVEPRIFFKTNVSLSSYSCLKSSEIEKFIRS